MISHEIRLLFRCDDGGTGLISTVAIIKVLQKAGFDVESGPGILMIRELPPKGERNSHDV